MFTRSHLQEMKRRYKEMYVSPEEGTDELVDQYKKETPGQSEGIEEDTDKDEPGTQGDQAEYQRKHNVRPGTDEWFKLWFARPKLTGENPMPKSK